MERRTRRAVGLVLVAGLAAVLVLLALVPCWADSASVRAAAAQRAQERDLAALVQAAEETAKNSREMVRLQGEVLKELRRMDCRR